MNPLVNALREKNNSDNFIVFDEPITCDITEWVKSHMNTRSVNIRNSGAGNSTQFLGYTTSDTIDDAVKLLEYCSHKFNMPTSKLSTVSAFFSEVRYIKC